MLDGSRAECRSFSSKSSTNAKTKLNPTIEKTAICRNTGNVESNRAEKLRIVVRYAIRSGFAMDAFPRK